MRRQDNVFDGKYENEVVKTASLTLSLCLNDIFLHKSYVSYFMLYINIRKQHNAVFMNHCLFVLHLEENYLL